MSKKLNVLALIVAVASFGLLTACEQKSDLEKDMEKAGKQMEKSADDAMKKLDGAMK
jgi:predicted small secreted protein